MADRISHLPTELQQHILSLLPITEAARTRELSWAWNNIWSFPTHVRLIDNDPHRNKDRFIRYCNCVMNHLDSLPLPLPQPPLVHSLTFASSRLHYADYIQIHYYLLIACKHLVTEVYLDVHAQQVLVEGFTGFMVPFTLVSPKMAGRLVSVFLRGTIVPQSIFHALLSCPTLVNLSVDGNFDYTIINFSTPPRHSLQYLLIEQWRGLRHVTFKGFDMVRKLHMQTPRESLKMTGFFQLKDLTLSRPIELGVLADVFSTCKSLESLMITPILASSRALCDVLTSTNVSNLKCLHIKFRQNDLEAIDNWEFLKKALSKIPRLEQLTITFPRSSVNQLTIASLKECLATMDSPEFVLKVLEFDGFA